MIFATSIYEFQFIAAAAHTVAQLDMPNFDSPKSAQLCKIAKIKHLLIDIGTIMKILQL